MAEATPAVAPAVEIPPAAQVLKAPPAAAAKAEEQAPTIKAKEKEKEPVPAKEPVAKEPAKEPVAKVKEPVTRVKEPVEAKAPVVPEKKPAVVKAPVAKEPAKEPVAKVKEPVVESDPNELIPAVPEIPEGSQGEVNTHSRSPRRKPSASQPQAAKAEAPEIQPQPPFQSLEEEATAAGIVLDEGEELRRCEWERCGKVFAVKVTGRTVVRRFCSGTCRGRASEARTGKRGKE